MDGNETICVPKSVSLLEGILSQRSDICVRMDIIDSLVEFGGETAERILIEALDAEDGVIRRAAARALGELDSQLGTHALTQMLARGGADAKAARDALWRISGLGPLRMVLSPNVRGETIGESEFPKIRSSYRTVKGNRARSFTQMDTVLQIS